MAGKQAKIVDEAGLELMLRVVQDHRYPIRDRALVLLSYKAGMRAAEIAQVTWFMVMRPNKTIDEVLALENRIAKKKSGRTIPLAPVLQQALMELWDWTHITRRRVIGMHDPIILSERSYRPNPQAPLEVMRATSIGYFFWKLYRKCGLEGCSSHSGRRTFITKGANLIVAAGGSLRDVQQLAGHRSLQQTQTYIEGMTEAKRNLVKII